MLREILTAKSAHPQRTPTAREMLVIVIDMADCAFHGRFLVARSDQADMAAIAFHLCHAKRAGVREAGGLEIVASTSFGRVGILEGGSRA